MASPGSDRENSSSSSSGGKSENPFIQFKRYTDAKVSSILQGILGLPSAFSSNANEPKTRWADFDDDLKRRDELQARQRALKNSESRELNNEDENVGKVSKEISGFFATPQCNPNNQHNVMDDEGELHDVRFYSPVTKSLFAHLNRSPDDDQIEWKNQLFTSPELTWDILGKCWPWSGNIYKLHESQISSSPLNMVQAMTLNTLNRTAKRSECRWFHSDRSVLPYILFSPYSPLALSVQPTAVPGPRPVHTSYSDTSAGMRWCDAFEDLLLVSSGREMMPSKPLSPEDYESSSDTSQPTRSDTLHNKQTAISRMTWINGLQAQGLLERNAFLNRPSLSEVGLLLSLLSPLMAISSGEADREARSQNQRDLPETEEEIHEYFQSLASEAKKVNEEVRPPFSDIMSLVGFFENMANEAESVEQVVDRLEALRDQKFGQPAERSGNSKGFSLEAFLRGHPPTQRSAGTQTDMDSEITGSNNDDKELGGHQTQAGLFEQQRKELMMARQGQASSGGMHQEQSAQVSSTGRENSESKKNDRIISTITTTEQTTSVDGTKMTTVSVTKCYADGRSVTTETFHSETPNFDDIRRSWNQNNDEKDGREVDQKAATEKEGKEDIGKSKGRGWFWN